MPTLPEPDPFEIVRAWFDALNRSDAAAAAALYADTAENDQDEGRWFGRDGQRAWLEGIFARSEGAFDDGGRRRLSTLAAIERGWIHAEWVGRERLPPAGNIVETVGYDHFLIEGRSIARQRGVCHPGPAADPHPASPHQDGRPRPSRAYPERPIVGVGAVIEQTGRVVLVRRRYEPLAGQWSLPGGTLELGEGLEAGVAREMLEETGLVVEVGPVVEVFDRILMDEDRRVRYHYVLIDYLCHPIGGSLRHGSDVDDAVFVEPARLDEYRLTPKALGVIHRALTMAGGDQAPRSRRPFP